MIYFTTPIHTAYPRSILGTLMGTDPDTFMLRQICVFDYCRPGASSQYYLDESEFIDYKPDTDPDRTFYTMKRFTVLKKNGELISRTGILYIHHLAHPLEDDGEPDFSKPWAQLDTPGYGGRVLLPPNSDNLVWKISRGKEHEWNDL